MTTRRALPFLLVTLLLASFAALAPAAAVAKPKAPKPKPNLQVDSITGLPTSSGHGANNRWALVTLRVEVHNAGTVATPATQLRVRLSTDKVSDGHDVTVVPDVTTPGLARGASKAVLAKFYVPATVTGPRYAIACADAPNKVLESNESDNCRATSNADVVMPTPTTPVVTGTSPSGIGTATTVAVLGTATPHSSVFVYTNATCTDPAVPSPYAATAPASGPFSVNAHAAANATTSFYARAVNHSGTSACSTTHVSYTNDSTPPALPQDLTTNPAVEGFAKPHVTGTTEAHAAVALFVGVACTGTPADAATADANGAFDILYDGADLTSNEATHLYVQVADAYGNHACSGALDYTFHANHPPVPVLASLPTSNDVHVSVSGTADDNASVAVYAGADCSGQPVGTATADGSGNWAADVTVGENTTTQFVAMAHSVNGYSACSMPVTHVNDHEANAPALNASTTPASPDATARPHVGGTIDEAGTVTLYPLGNCSGTVLASGSFDGAGPWDLQLANDAPVGTSLSIYAQLVDQYGNPSACTAAPVTYLRAPVAVITSPTNDTGVTNSTTLEVDGMSDSLADVSIYTTSDCTGPAVDTTADEVGAFSADVTIAQGGTTTITANAVVGAATSACSAPVTINEDELAPGIPNVNSINHTSGAIENPTISGTGGAQGSTLYIYPTADCSGPLWGSTNPAGDAWTVTLNPGHIGSTSQTYHLYSLAIDAGHQGGCSSTSVTYTHEPTLNIVALNDEWNGSTDDDEGIVPIGEMLHFDFTQEPGMHNLVWTAGPDNFADGTHNSPNAAGVTGPSFMGGDTESGTYDVTLNTAGIYQWWCGFHTSTMEGTIQVAGLT
jgi:plastocyanin